MSRFHIYGILAVLEWDSPLTVLCYFLPNDITYIAMLKVDWLPNQDCASFSLQKKGIILILEPFGQKLSYLPPYLAIA